MEAFNYIAISISIAGSIIIIWGVLVTMVHIINHERKKVMDGVVYKNDEETRHQFSSYLLLGLDFMLAADILHTIHNPILNELYILAMIVGIRSVISFFLIKEMGSIKTDNYK